METRTVTFRLSEDLIEDLKAVSEITGKTMTDIVTETTEREVAEFRNRNGKVKPLEAILTILTTDMSEYEKKVTENESGPFKQKEHKCYILSEEEVFGTPYYRIYDCETKNVKKVPREHVTIVEKSLISAFSKCNCDVPSEEELAKFNPIREAGAYSDYDNNMLVFGTPGSGKSYTMKADVINTTTEDPETQVLIIDLEGNYTKLGEKLGAVILKIAPGSEDHINPMDIVHTENDQDSFSDVCDKISFFMEFYCALNGAKNISVMTANAIDRALVELYESDSRPTISNLCKILDRQDGPEAKQIKECLSELIENDGGLFSNETTLPGLNPKIDELTADQKILGKLSKPGSVIIYDLSGLYSNGRYKAAILTCLSDSWNRIRVNCTEKRRTRLYIDEMWPLFRNGQSDSFLFTMFKRARTHFSSIISATSAPESIIASEENLKFLIHAGTVLILNSKPENIKCYENLYRITKDEKKWISCVSPGKGLLISRKLRRPVDFKK